MITQEQLVELADRWPIDWIPKKRTPTCADCGHNTTKPWHCWFKAGGYAKEIHLCWRCGKKYNL